MKKTFLYLLLFPLTSTSLLAQAQPSAEPTERQESAARTLARRWMVSHQKHTLGQGTAAVDTTLFCQNYNKAWCYRSAGQFVVVSKSADLPAVVGYGSEASASSPLPAALEALLNEASSSTAHEVYPPRGAEWTVTEPLLKSHHGFWSPYNDLCPYYTDSEGNTSPNRCVVGCVAIAMEQILAYYKRNYTLQQTLEGWTTNHYRIDSIPKGTQVDASKICDVYNTGSESQEQELEVARLMYYLGVAAHMNWGLSASGTSTTRLFKTLPQAFGLKYAKYLDGYCYTPTNFWNILAHEIMAQRPVYLSASNKTLEGHAFVLDGIDADGLFHVNWGYGAYDGYFRLDVLSVRQPADEHKLWVDDGYNCNYEAIAVCPDEATNPVWMEPIERNGAEIAVDSVWAVQEPSTQCYTTVRMAVRNTTGEAINSPLALLTFQTKSSSSEAVSTDDAASTDDNTPATDNVEYSVAALTGCTLEPYQCDTLQLLAQFTQSGAQTLGVTPTDEESLIYTLPLNVGDCGVRNLNLGEPQICFNPNNTAASITLPIGNPSVTERAANLLTVNLLDNVTNQDVEKSYEIFLTAPADTTLTASFSSLQPGRSYTCRIGYDGNTIRSVNFTLPGTDGIVSPEMNEAQAASYFGLEGKRLLRPECLKGVIIEKRGKLSRKKMLR